MRSCTCCVVAVLVSFVVPVSTFGQVPPTVHVIWLQIPPAVEDVNFEIDDTDPHFPKVQLISPSDTWIIWSTDPDNPGQIGDIGEITSPNPENFGVRVVAPNGIGPGARDVKGISLIPSDSANYSDLLKINLTGSVLGDLKVQRSIGVTPTGGSINDVAIPGHVVGNITADAVGKADLTITGDVIGDITERGTFYFYVVKVECPPFGA